MNPPGISPDLQFSKDSTSPGAVPPLVKIKPGAERFIDWLSWGSLLLGALITCYVVRSYLLGDFHNRIDWLLFIFLPYISLGGLAQVSVFVFSPSRKTIAIFLLIEALALTCVGSYGYYRALQSHAHIMGFFVLVTRAFLMAIVLVSSFVLFVTLAIQKRKKSK